MNSGEKQTAEWEWAWQAWDQLGEGEHGADVPLEQADPLLGLSWAAGMGEPDWARAAPSLHHSHGCLRSAFWVRALNRCYCWEGECSRCGFECPPATSHACHGVCLCRGYEVTCSNRKCSALSFVVWTLWSASLFFLWKVSPPAHAAGSRPQKTCELCSFPESSDAADAQSWDFPKPSPTLCQNCKLIVLQVFRCLSPAAGEGLNTAKYLTKYLPKWSLCPEPAPARAVRIPFTTPGLPCNLYCRCASVLTVLWPRNILCKLSVFTPKIHLFKES